MSKINITIQKLVSDNINFVVYEIDQYYNITKTKLKDVNRRTLVKYNTSNKDNDVDADYYDGRSVEDSRAVRIHYYSQKTDKSLQSKFDKCLKLIKSSIACVCLEEDDVCNDFVVVITK